jgi:hypothetical protein
LGAARVAETGVSRENGVLEHWSDGIAGSIYLKTRQYSIAPARMPPKFMRFINSQSQQDLGQE